ncbi:lipid-A-disaccharide synthase [Flavobacteriaceae bacterium]|nr:lipid-A-disaccharide synthase [Flavobacteriaceae bacterium]MDA9374810.1 lipid-A-disaccharide synthase [Flavobacteriaceae bacterium]MDB4013512.1 lipid-A-disaccharide synthase [Flavobacteriaceae bacterium]
MKYYIIAGEASGDLHASNLIKEIIKLEPNADIRAWGGDKMQNAGANVVKHFKDLAFMGFYEVLINLRTILKNISFCKKDILEFNPDKIIFVDYPGFNMRIAKWSKKYKFQTIYYIAPQLWAWNEKRIKKIKKYIDSLYVILPFEKEFFETKHKYPVKFLGHPLLDSISNFKKNYDSSSEQIITNKKAVIAILPGSRKQEIKKILNTVIKIVDYFPDHQFIVAGAPNIELSYYKSILKNKRIKVIENKSYEILSISTAAIVTSGTATLETALFKVPQVVCYKSSYFSYFIAKLIVNIKYISLVNLIMDQQIVKELIQQDCNKDKIRNELEKILDLNNKKSLQIKYDELTSILGNNGTSKRVALDIIKK